MRIEFVGTTNKDYVMINIAKFKLKSGSVITIDRDTTEYTIENGKLDMLWRGCYMWAIDNWNIFDDETYITDADEFAKLVDGAELELELEDDADEDYEVKIERWNID